MNDMIRDDVTFSNIYNDEKLLTGCMVEMSMS